MYHDCNTFIQDITGIAYGHGMFTVDSDYNAVTRKVRRDVTGSIGRSTASFEKSDHMTDLTTSPTFFV